MKRLLITLLLLIFLLTGCGKSASTLPTLGALAPLSDNTIKEIVLQYDRDALLSVWGMPERTMDGNCGDVWRLTEQREMVVLYGENGKAFAIMFHE